MTLFVTKSAAGKAIQRGKLAMNASTTSAAFLNTGFSHAVSNRAIPDEALREDAVIRSPTSFALRYLAQCNFFERCFCLWAAR